MLKKQTIPQNLNARLAKVTALEEALAEVRGNLTRTRNELEEVREDLAGSIQDRNFWMRSAQSWQRKFEQAQLERNRAIEDMVAAAAGQEIRRPVPAGLIRPGRRGAVGEDAVLFQEEPPMPEPDFNRGIWPAPAAPRPVRQEQAHIGNGWDDPPMANPRPARHDEADMQQANARPARANAHPPGWDDLMARLGVQEAQLRGQVNEARRQRVNIHNYPAQAAAAEAQAAAEAARAVGRQVLFDMEQQVVRVAGAVGEQLADPFEQYGAVGQQLNAELAHDGQAEPEPYDPAPPEPDEDPGRADW